MIRKIISTLPKRQAHEVHIISLCSYVPWAASWISSVTTVFGSASLFFKKLIASTLQDTRYWSNFRKKKSEYPQLRSWTFPVLVDGPFGVVSAAELVVIILTVIYSVVTLSACIINDNTMIGRIPFPSYKNRYLSCFSRYITWKSAFTTHLVFNVYFIRVALHLRWLVIWTHIL